jgi:hypothetical protein
MDRSSIIGAVASLEEHLKTDYDSIFRKARLKAVKMAEEWEKIPGVETKLYDVGEVPEEPGRISLHVTPSIRSDDLDKIVLDLMQGDTPIWISHEGKDLIINITSFRGLMLTESKDTKTIIKRMTKALSK